MKIPYRYRPGGGFLLLIAVGALVVAFAVWGFRTPPLERAWRLLEQVDHGYVLSADEVAFMDEALRAYPGITEDILDDAAVDLLEPDVEGFSLAPATHLLLAPIGATGRTFELTCRGAARYPVTVSLNAPKLHKTLTFTAQGTKRLYIKGDQASAGPEAPFLVTLRVSGDFATPNAQSARDAERGLRVRAVAAAPAGEKDGVK